MTKTDRLSLSLLLFFSAFHLFWVFYLPILPFVDLPFHLAESVVLKNFNNHELLFSKYFLIPTLIKSNSIYIYFCSLNIFPNVEFGNRIFYSIYIILLPLSSYIFIKTVRGNSVFALLSYLFLINHNVHWGFVSYMMSIPVLMLTFTVFYYYFVLKTHALSYIIWLIFILIFALHFQMAIFALLVFVILTLIYQRKSASRIAINMLSMVPVLCIMIYAYTIDSGEGTTSLFSYMLTYYTSNYLSTFLNRFTVLFVIDNYFILGGANGVYYSFLLTIPPALLMIYMFYKTRFIPLIKNPETAFLMILFGISFSCFIFLPDIIPGQNVIFERYSVIIFLIIFVLISVNSLTEKWIKIAILTITLMVLVHSIVIQDYMLDFKKSTSDFTPELFPNTNNEKLAGIMLDNDFRGNKLYAHFPMYYTVWKNGVTTGLIDYRFGLIKRNVSVDTLPKYIEWLDNDKTNYDEYYKPVDYILVRAKEELKFNNFIREKKSGAWEVYKSINK